MVRFFPLAKTDAFFSDFSPAKYSVLFSLLHKVTHLTSNEEKEVSLKKKKKRVGHFSTTQTIPLGIFISFFPPFFPNDTAKAI